MDECNFELTTLIGLSELVHKMEETSSLRMNLQKIEEFTKNELWFISDYNKFLREELNKKYN